MKLREYIWKHSMVNSDGLHSVCNKIYPGRIKKDWNSSH